MNRLKAAGLHLLLSFCIVVLVLTTMYLLWYPNLYFNLMGGGRLIIVLAGVDVFLGPLLTLTVYKAGKKGLRFDLFCIGIVQIAALSYGIYVMFAARPVFTVFNRNQFQVSSVVDIAHEELAKAKKIEWRHFSVTGPILVAVGEPNKKDRKEAMFAQVERDNAHRYPRLYDEYNKHGSEVINAGKPVISLAADSIENKATIDKFLTKVNRPATDFLVLPISSELAEMTAIIDAKTGDFIEIVDAKPKPISHKK